MSKKWGPITWILFHSLAERIIEESFLSNREKIFGVITGIIQNLPCPECRYHATNYFKKININNYKTKDEFKLMLYNFHNAVNLRLGKETYSVSALEKYKLSKLIAIWKLFKLHYTQNNYSRLLSEQLTRKLLLGRIQPIIFNNTIFNL